MHRTPLASATLLILASTGCGDDAQPTIAPTWSTVADGDLAPPGDGAADRLVVARRAAPGSFETRSVNGGRIIEGPFEALPTAHAPVMVDADVFLVGQVSGRISKLNLAGQESDFSDARLGTTGPLVTADDGGLRIAANAGQLAIFAPAGGDPVQAALPGPSDSPPAVDDAGTTYVATDVGRVVGISSAGDSVFDVMVPAPASGVSLGPDRVAVGGLSGVHVFDRAGAEVFTHDRSARVVGTAFTADGDVLAWGEDGVVERLAPDGTPRFSLTVGPPVYIPVLELPDGNLAVIDNDATAYLVSSSGEILDQTTVAPDETAAPLRQVVQRGALVFVTRGRTLAGINFAFLP